MKMNKLSHAIIATIAGLSASAVYAQDSNTSGDAIEEIVVQGFRASLVKASDKKRNAESIQDSIVAEDLGKMPDQNVAESLQRIPGVSISRSGGEGSKISIRGFGPQFNVVKMNDRTLATTGTDRSFDFAVLPSELISGADIVKSPTAKLSSGSIGGFTNLHSARPLDNTGFHASGSVNAKYQDLNQELNPEISGVISNTFADDTIGVLLGVSYKDTDNRIDNYAGTAWGEYGNRYGNGSSSGYGFPLNKSLVLDETGKPTTLAGSRGPGRVRYTMNLENRERLGANVTLQWAPSENVVSTFDAIYSKLDIESSGSGIQVATQEDWFSAASVNSRTGTLRTATQTNHDLEFLINTGDNTSDTEAYGYNLKYTEGKLTLTGDVSYSKSTASGVGDNNTALRFVPVSSAAGSSVTLDFTHGDIPYMTTTGFDLTDPSTVRLHWQDLNGGDSKDEVKEAKFDAKYEIDTGIVKSLEAGVAYSNRELLSRGYSVHVNPNGGWPPSVMYFEDGTDIADSVFHKTPSNYMSGVGGVFPRQWVAPTSSKAYRDASQAWIEAHANESIWGQPRSFALSSPTGRWDYLYPDPANISSEETTESVYLQTNLGGDLGDKVWSGNVGGRYVTTDNDSTGFNTTIGELTLVSTNPIHNAAAETYAKSTVSSSDSYFLPSANFSLDLNGGNYVRVGAAKTITRPSLSDSSATFREAAGFAGPGVNISGSNPYLKPYQVKSFDLSFEHYGENGTAYSAGYFFKDITSFISQITTIGVWKGPVQQALLDAYAKEGINKIDSVTTGPQNRKGGTVHGLEFGAVHTFDNLPGIWSGLGVQANYTYATSKDRDAVKINRPSVVEPESGLEGFAKNAYNLVAFYDKDSVEIRLGYNYTGKFMNSRSGDGISPIYTDAYGQLDFSASYDINENLTASLAINNLTNETRVDYLGQRDRVGFVELTGSRYQLGLRAKF